MVHGPDMNAQHLLPRPRDKRRGLHVDHAQHLESDGNEGLRAAHDVPLCHVVADRIVADHHEPIPHRLFLLPCHVGLDRFVSLSGQPDPAFIQREIFADHLGRIVGQVARQTQGGQRKHSRGQNQAQKTRLNSHATTHGFLLSPWLTCSGAISWRCMLLAEVYLPHEIRRLHRTRTRRTAKEHKTPRPRMQGGKNTAAL